METNKNKKPATMVDDPFDVPSEDTKTDMPLIAKTKMTTVEIVEAEVKASESDPNRENLKLKVITTKPEKLTDGTTAPEGWPLFHNVPLTPTEKMTIESVKRSLGLVCKGAGLKGLTLRQVIDDPQVLVGKLCSVAISISPAKGDFEEMNRLRFIPQDETEDVPNVVDEE